MKKIVILTIVLLLALLSISNAGPKESYYQKVWCDQAQGKTEVVMPDKSRCDCLTENFAIEFDFDKKWAEAVGQSLLYSSYTGKTPGIVLIGDDAAYMNRVFQVINTFKLPIRVWFMDKIEVPDTAEPAKTENTEKKIE